MHDMHIGFMNLTVCQSLIFTRRGPHIWSWTGTEGVQCTLSAHIHMHAWWLTWSRLGSPRPYYLLAFDSIRCELAFGYGEGEKADTCMYGYNKINHASHQYACNNICMCARSQCKRAASMCKRPCLLQFTLLFMAPKEEWIYIYVIARTPVHAPLF